LTARAAICSVLGLLLYFSSHCTGTSRASPFTKAIRLSSSFDVRLRCFSSAFSQLSPEFHYRIFFPDGEGKPNQPMQTTASLHVPEVGPRKEHRGVTLISDLLPFSRGSGRIFEETN